MEKYSLGNKQYVFSLSFANYHKEKNGVPKAILAHKQIYLNQGISYVHVFLIKKTFLKDQFEPVCFYGLTIDDQYQGIISIQMLMKLFQQWQVKEHQMIDIHIHHLMYTKLGHIKKLLDGCQVAPIKLYLHDYYLVCSNYNLMKNNMQYCGPEGMFEEKCKDCSSYIVSKKRVNALKKLIDSYHKRVQFIAPSNIAKNIFLNSWREYVHQVHVIPHQVLVGEYKENNEMIASDERIRVAFLGMPMKHKGWEMWQQLVKEHVLSVGQDQISLANRKEYDFFVFNSSKEEYLGMTKVKVEFTNDQMNAMVSALRDYKIHIVVLWALWPETYSYTCFESFAANTYIITNRSSGNIGDVVERRLIGTVLESEQELYGLFRNPIELRAEVNQYRSHANNVPLHLLENEEIIFVSSPSLAISTPEGNGCD